MDFNKFWKSLQNELKYDMEFKTLRQSRGFKAHFEHGRDGDPRVHVTLKFGKSRANIPRYQFEGIWDNAKGHSHETRFVNENGRLDFYTLKNGGKGQCYNISYILALINYVVKNQSME